MLQPETAGAKTSDRNSGSAFSAALAADCAASRRGHAAQSAHQSADVPAQALDLRAPAVHLTAQVLTHPVAVRQRLLRHHHQVGAPARVIAVNRHVRAAFAFRLASCWL